MALNLYISFRGTTLDATHDFTAGDNTLTLTSTAAINTDAALWGTNGLDCPTAGDSAQLAVSSQDIFESSVGGFAVGFRLQSFATTRPLVNARNTATPNHNISLELVGTDDATGRELLLRIRQSGGINATLSTTAADMALNTKYFAVCRYNEPANDRKLQLYDGTTGTLITEVEDLATNFDVPTGIDLLNIGESSGGALDVHIDNFFAFDDYNEAVEDFFDIDSYTDYGVSDPAPVITDVDTDESFTATQTNVVITGTDFDTATVDLIDGSLEVSQSIDSQNSTTIQFDANIGTAPGIRYGSRTLRVTNGDDQTDTQAVTITAPSGKNYVDLSGTLADPEERLESSADLEAGDQVEWSNVLPAPFTIADVTVNIDGSFTVEAGVESFDFRVHNVDDGWGSIETQTIDEEGAPEITTVALDDATAGSPYTETLEATGAVPLTWVANDALPTGLTLDPDSGIISGTPTTQGTSTIGFQVSNINGTSAEVELDIEVIGAVAGGGRGRDKRGRGHLHRFLMVGRG